MFFFCYAIEGFFSTISFDDRHKNIIKKGIDKTIKIE